MTLTLTSSVWGWAAVVALGTACAVSSDPAERAPAEVSGAVTPLQPAGATEAVAADADDPAIWLDPVDPSRSVIFGTDKVAARGGLHVFGLDGRRRQVLQPLDRPNNVDVETDVAGPGGTLIDVAVVTERLQHRLRAFIVPDDGGPLVDLAPEGLPVLAGEVGEASEPMGIALYRRPADHALFAIVAPKTGPSVGYLRQYRLRFDDDPPTATEVRRFGAFSGQGPAPGEAGEIEAVVADDESGYVYYADERFGLRKWHADPEHPERDRELAVFGRDQYLGDREGLALYRAADGDGYLVSSDQVAGGTRLMIYPRRGVKGDPHAHPLLAVVPTVADETDGLDVTSVRLPGFEDGLVVMMNSRERNFLLFSWTDLQRWLQPPVVH